MDPIYLVCKVLMMMMMMMRTMFGADSGLSCSMGSFDNLHIMSFIIKYWNGVPIEHFKEFNFLSMSEDFLFRTLKFSRSLCYSQQDLFFIIF